MHQSSIAVRSCRLDDTNDDEAVDHIIQAAFDEKKERTRAVLASLRHHPSYEARLALLAVKDTEIVGYSLMTRVNLSYINYDHHLHQHEHHPPSSSPSSPSTIPTYLDLPSLLLWPVAVLPMYQHQGIATLLIKASLTKAALIGYRCVFVDPEQREQFYQRHGFDSSLTQRIHTNSQRQQEKKQLMGITLQHSDLQLFNSLPELMLHYPTPLLTIKGGQEEGEEHRTYHNNSNKIKAGLDVSGTSISAHLSIRSLTEDHWESIYNIWLAGSLTGHATFEISDRDWKSFNEHHLPHSRFVVVDSKEEEVYGWAALAPTSTRACYAGVAEISVYVSPVYRGQGIGSMLLQKLISSSEANGIWTLQSAIIASNITSIALHKTAGFRVVGIRHKIGQFEGNWKDVVVMERRSKTTEYH